MLSVTEISAYLITIMRFEEVVLFYLSTLAYLSTHGKNCCCRWATVIILAEWHLPSVSGPAWRTVLQASLTSGLAPHAVT